MKKYCLSCGYGNEYTDQTPEKCGKCKTDMSEPLKQALFSLKNVVTKVENNKQIYGTVDENGKIERGLPDSDFDSYLEEPEAISENEIEKIFLSKANRGINLRDLVKEGEKNAPKPQTRKRKKK